MGDKKDEGLGRKNFIPLENNPEVMTDMVHRLGLSRDLSFHDVYSLTEPSLLSFLPRPAHALLLVFPITSRYETFRQEEDSSREGYAGSGPEEEVTWFKQTIGNACGLIGLLHCVCNGGARARIGQGTDLDRLLAEAVPLDPAARAELLYRSDKLESAHAAAAQKGDSSAPRPGEAVDLHFVAFVKHQLTGDLWELDGRRKGPINRGNLAEDEDVLSEKGQELGVQAFLKREQQQSRPTGEAVSGVDAGSGESSDLRFSVIMLGPAFD